MFKKIYYRLLFLLTKGSIRQDVKRAFVCESCTEVFFDFEKYDFAKDKFGDVYCTKCGCYNVYDSNTGEMVNKQMMEDLIKSHPYIPESDTDYISRGIAEMKKRAIEASDFIEATDVTFERQTRERQTLKWLRYFHRNLPAHQQEILVKLISDSYDISTANYRRVKRCEASSRNRYSKKIDECFEEYERCEYVYSAD